MISTKNMSQAEILHLMDLCRPLVTAADPDVPYLGAATNIAKLIVNRNDRLDLDEVTELLAAGALLLSQLALSTGRDRLSEILADRGASRGRAE